MCWMCRASSTAGDHFVCKLWPWRWVAHNARRPFVLFAYVVGLRLECTMMDVLHTVDQGVATHIIANVFWELICAHTQAANTEALQQEMKAWYVASGTTTRL